MKGGRLERGKEEKIKKSGVRERERERERDPHPSFPHKYQELTLDKFRKKVISLPSSFLSPYLPPSLHPSLHLSLSLFLPPLPPLAGHLHIEVARIHTRNVCVCLFVCVNKDKGGRREGGK